MKSSINSSVIKSTTIEIISPKLVESPSFERYRQKKSVIKGTAVVENLVMTNYDQTMSDYNPASLYAENAYKNIVSLAEQEEISDLLLQAKREAEHLVAEAKKQADLILQTALEDRDSLRETLEKSIKEEVIPLAHAEGYDKGLTDAKEEAEKIRMQAKKYLQFAESALKDEFQRVDKELLSLCIKISERIIHSSLSLEPSRLLNVIRDITLIDRKSVV